MLDLVVAGVRKCALIICFSWCCFLVPGSSLVSMGVQLFLILNSDHCTAFQDHDKVYAAVCAACFSFLFILFFSLLFFSFLICRSTDSKAAADEKQHCFTCKEMLSGLRWTRILLPHGCMTTWLWRWGSWGRCPQGTPTRPRALAAACIVSCCCCKPKHDTACQDNRAGQTGLLHSKLLLSENFAVSFPHAPLVALVKMT